MRTLLAFFAVDVAVILGGWLLLEPRTAVAICLATLMSTSGAATIIWSEKRDFPLVAAYAGTLTAALVGIAVFCGYVVGLGS